MKKNILVLFISFMALLCSCKNLNNEEVYMTDSISFDDGQFNLKIAKNEMTKEERLYVCMELIPNKDITIERDTSYYGKSGAIVVKIEDESQNQIFAEDILIPKTDDLFMIKLSKNEKIEYCNYYCCAEMIDGLTDKISPIGKYNVYVGLYNQNIVWYKFDLAITINL